MMLVICWLYGNALGYAVCRYLSGFSARLSEQVLLNFCEMFPQNPPHFAADHCALTPLKCGHFFYYILGFGVLLVLLASLFDPFTGLWLGSYVALLFCVAIIDGYYQLISPTLCQLLFVCAVVRAYFVAVPVDLIASLQGASFGFLAFYGLYYAAKWVYRREALGRGDYWLMLGLGGVTPIVQLPWLVLGACLSALIYVGYLSYRGMRPEWVAFGPFLSLAGGGILLLNLYSLA